MQLGIGTSLKATWKLTKPRNRRLCVNCKKKQA